MNDATQSSFTELLDRVAKRAGKTTILQHTPSGGCVVWVSPNEADPLTALMSAALTIMIKRGFNPDSKSGVSIRRVTEGLIAPGCEYYWQVTDNSGAVLAFGYAKDEHEAGEEVVKHLKLNPAV